MPDLLEEAKRLSERASRVLQARQEPSQAVRDSVALIPELVERVEQAEHERDILRLFLGRVRETAPELFETEPIRKLALAAHQRVVER